MMKTIRRQTEALPLGLISNKSLLPTQRSSLTLHNVLSQQPRITPSPQIGDAHLKRSAMQIQIQATGATGFNPYLIGKPFRS
jgi:hypothetical protein